MKHKKIIFACLIIILVVVVILKPSKSSNEKIDNESISSKVDSFTEQVIDDTYTKKDIEKIVGQEISSMDLLVGKDSYLRNIPVVSGEDISLYEKKLEEYAFNVESYIKENLDYKIDNVVETVDNQTLVNLTIKTYYYRWYLNDLIKLQNEIGKIAGYDYETLFDGKPSNDTKLHVFKSKVKSMELLNDYLEDYVNDYEYLSVEIVYDLNDPKITNASLMSYYLQLSGMNYKNKDFSTKEFQEEQSLKIQNIIDAAISNGTLDENNPLKLN